MKRIQIILSVALLTAPVALLTASSALAQAEAGSEPGSYQAPVVEQVEPQDIPSAEGVGAMPRPLSLQSELRRKLSSRRLRTLQLLNSPLCSREHSPPLASRAPTVLNCKKTKRGAWSAEGHRLRRHRWKFTLRVRRATRRSCSSRSASTGAAGG